MGESLGETKEELSSVPHEGGRKRNGRRWGKVYTLRVASLPILPIL